MTNSNAADNLVAISGELKNSNKLDFKYFKTLMRAMLALWLTNDKMIDLYEIEVFQNIKKEVEDGQCDEK